MKPHVTPGELELLERGALPPDRILALTRHLSACAACSALARASVEGAAHPDLESELFAFADATLPAEARVQIERHLANCATCREDVDDALRTRLAVTRRPRRTYLVPASIAASLAILLGAYALLRPATPNVPPQTRTITIAPAPAGYGRADWTVLVATARASGQIVAPAMLTELRGTPDTLRGPSRSAHAELQPAGVVVESTRPTFTWPGAKRASYLVTVADGDEVVARSPVLHAARWTPPDPLRRGRTYVWQVELRESQTRLPSPDAPPAMFHVLEETTARELDEAHRRFPDDRLLLGLLYARAGVADRAREELAQFAAAHPEDAAARQLAESVGRW
jgi:anti-sigma factor RsiW